MDVASMLLNLATLLDPSAQQHFTFGLCSSASSPIIDMFSLTESVTAAFAERSFLINTPPPIKYRERIFIKVCKKHNPHLSLKFEIDIACQGDSSVSFS